MSHSILQDLVQRRDHNLVVLQNSRARAGGCEVQGCCYRCWAGDKSGPELQGLEAAAATGAVDNSGLDLQARAAGMW